MPLFKDPTTKYYFRWIVSFSILANIFFTYAYNYFTGALLVTEIAEQYPTYFTPSGSAYLIWGFIYIVFTVYGIIQVLPSQRSYSIYDKLSGPLLIVNILLSLWLFLYTSNSILSSVFVIAALLALSLFLFNLSHKAVLKQGYNLWLQLPFCLLSSWLTLAFMSELSVCFLYLDWSPSIGEGLMAFGMILTVTIVSILVNMRTSSLVFPAVIAWGLFAVSAARDEDASQVANAAMGWRYLFYYGLFCFQLQIRSILLQV